MIPHIVRGGTVRELADTYKNPLSVFRELPANVYDQSRHQEAQERFPVVRIYIHKSRKRFWVEDYMTGIPNKDMEDFLAIGNKTASRSDGKVVGSEVSSREHINPRILGKKHVGKLSCLFASETGDTEYFANNGKNGHYLHMTYDGWQDFNDLPFDILDTTSALNHIGLRVIVNDAKKECLNIKSVEKAVSKWFGILLSKKKIKIIIIDVDNNNKEIDVQKPADLDTKGEISLPMSNGFAIRTNLKETETTVLGYTLDIYQQEVYVRSIPFPSHMVTGYVNYDGLDLNTPREDYADDAEFNEVLGRYIAMTFPRNYIPEPKKQMGEKQKETIVKVIEEVCTAISKVHPELLVDLFGYATPFGLEGKILKNPRITPTEPHDWITTMVTYGPDGLPIIPGGDGTTGGGGGGKPPTGTVGGDSTGKIPRQPPTDPDTPKLVMPQIDIMDGIMGDIPTISARVIQEEKRLEVVINASKPASSIFRKAGSIERYREVCYDKFISAIIKLKYDSNDLGEFEKKKEEIWNALYQEGNGIQEQTEQMISTTKARRDSKAGRK